MNPWLVWGELVFGLLIAPTCLGLILWVIGVKLAGRDSGYLMFASFMFSLMLVGLTAAMFSEIESRAPWQTQAIIAGLIALVILAYLYTIYMIRKEGQEEQRDVNVCY